MEYRLRLVAGPWSREVGIDGAGRSWAGKWINESSQSGLAVDGDGTLQRRQTGICRPAELLRECRLPPPTLTFHGTYLRLWLVSTANRLLVWLRQWRISLSDTWGF